MATEGYAPRIEAHKKMPACCEAERAFVWGELGVMDYESWLDSLPLSIQIRRARSGDVAGKWVAQAFGGCFRGFSRSLRTLFVKLGGTSTCTFSDSLTIALSCSYSARTIS